MALPQALQHLRNQPPLKLVVPTTSVTTEPSPRLWLALVFPALALEALGIHSDDIRPIAVLDSEDPRAAVCATTVSGKEQGIAIGQSAQTVLSHVPDVQFICRDQAAEMRKLTELASWAYRFTPTISVQAPEALLLEMRGSLHLFGDPQKLQQRLHEELSTLGHQVCASFAPTPRAALWFARAGCEVHLDDLGRLRSALGELPLTVLPDPPPWREAFHRLGLRRLRDLLRLPRDGLTRRFGPELLSELDRALGTVPDPITLWTEPSQYEASQDLGFDVWQADRLLPVIEQLLADLEAELRHHDAGIRSFQLVFSDWHATVNSLPIGTREVTRNCSHWMRLVRAHLENLVLTRAVEEVRLKSGRFEACVANAADLFTVGARDPTSITNLLDILRTRLGARGVTGLKAVATPRPEKAWRWDLPGKDQAPPPGFPPRPFWLLGRPETLGVTGTHPSYAGQPLLFDSGPERIECGGCTTPEVRRDYYRAHTTCGARLWVYREINPPQHWFLHGYFA